ncbi:hypothetical protein RAS1_35430 [Phycisphaerae bacterium RAS1]|nr:hypothetical protein RAS1_35430 [Phycisphaerae bacterium RAS1]
MFRLSLYTALLSVLALSTTAAAQPFDLSWHSIDGGGLMFGLGAAFELGGTSGQPDASADQMTGGSFALTGGFWVVASPAFALGDLNCDGAVNVLDINPFILALSDPAAYAAAYPTCEIANGDVNGDGNVDVLDINPFVALLSGG